jgi:hypothetical protein
VFEPTSRYYNIADAIYEDEDGHQIAYKRRRFLPPGEALPVLAEVTVHESDRLDLIAARTLGDPEQFWRVCDANNAMNPFDLLAEPVIRVPIPQFEDPHVNPLGETGEYGAEPEDGT